METKILIPESQPNAFRKSTADPFWLGRIPLAVRTKLATFKNSLAVSARQTEEKLAKPGPLLKPFLRPHCDTVRLQRKLERVLPGANVTVSAGGSIQIKWIVAPLNPLLAVAQDYGEEQDSLAVRVIIFWLEKGRVAHWQRWLLDVADYAAAKMLWHNPGIDLRHQLISAANAFAAADKSAVLGNNRVFFLPAADEAFACATDPRQIERQ